MLRRGFSDPLLHVLKEYADARIKKADTELPVKEHGGGGKRLWRISIGMQSFLRQLTGEGKKNGELMWDLEPGPLLLMKLVASIVSLANFL